jgi:hypothetical protein
MGETGAVSQGIRSQEVVEDENEKWKEEISFWAKASENWYKKRETLYEEYYGELNSMDEKEYCDDKGCYMTEFMSLSYESLDSSEFFKWKKTGGIKLQLTQGIYWKSDNDGQKLILKTSGSEFWESSNRGQSLQYIDNIGNIWSSQNRGQDLEYIGKDGSSWKSSNRGQILEFQDSQGRTWTSQNEE